MPTCVILRGLPGSGKSTVAAKLVNGDDGKICSADDYFCFAGEYRFKKEDLGKAHDSCFEHFKWLITVKSSPIVVDNTNTTEKEYKRYVDYAKERGYEVTIQTVETDLTDEELAARNVHSVPVETIRRMRERMKRG